MLHDHLEEVVLVKLLKNTSFQLNKVVAHHDGQQSLVACVDSNIESGGLQQEQHGVKKDVGDSQENMRNDADMISLLTPGFCSSPEESINGVLTKC